MDIKTNRPGQRNRGFTLIELMIVVALIAILAAIGFPTYQDQMRKARRSEATAVLLDIAARMERFYADRGTYTGATIGAGAGTDVYTSTTSENGHYTLTINPLAAESFTLNATPVVGGAQDGDDCGVFTLTSAGTKGFTGAGGTVIKCW